MDAVVSDAHSGGSELLAVGSREGTTYQPTLLFDPPDPARAVTEETFGPVTTIHPFKSIDDAIARPNDTHYWLATAVFTTDPSVTFKAATQLRVGQVMINESTDFESTQGHSAALEQVEVDEREPAAPSSK